MSGTLIPLQAHGIDPSKGYLDYNQSQLVGQQAQGASIANQGAAMNLAIQKQMLAPLLGGPQPGGGGQQGPMPWDAPAGAAGQQQQQQQPAAAPGGGINGAAGGQSSYAPSGPGQQPQGQGGGAPPGQTFVSPNGIMYPGMGVPIPRLWAMGILQSNDKQGAIGKAMVDRRLALGQLAAGAMGADGNTDPQAWNQSVKTAFDQGYLTNADSWRLYNHPELAQSVITSLVAPEQQPGVKAQTAGLEADARLPAQAAMARIQGAVNTKTAVDSAAAIAPIDVDKTLKIARGTIGPDAEKAQNAAAAGAQYQSIDVPMSNGDGTFSKKTMTRAQFAAYSGQPIGSDTLGGTQAQRGTTSQLAQNMRGTENAGNNPAQPNTSGPGGTPTSTASGDLQFTNPTWLSTVRKYAPDFAAGKSDAQVLALKGNSTLQGAMFDSYATENSAALRADGYSDSNAAVLLAHRYGPKGAEGILDALQSNPNATLKQVNPQAAASNPTLANRPVSSLAAEALTVAGRNGLDPKAPYQPPAAGTGPGGVKPPAGAAPGGAPPGFGVSAPEQTPNQKIASATDQKQMETDGTTIGKMQADVPATHAAQAQLFQIRQLADSVDAGKNAGLRQTANEYLATYGGGWGTAAGKMVGLNPDTAAKQEQFVKLTMNQAMSAARETTGAHTGYGVLQQVKQSMPNIEMQPTAIKDMSNVLLVAHQADLDHAAAASQHYNDSRDQFLQNPTSNRYQPLSKFNEGDWGIGAQTSVHNPRVYVAGAALLNGTPSATAFNGLTHEQQVEAIKIAARTDPSAKLRP